MPKRVIAVVPSLADFATIQNSLLPEGIEVHAACCLEHALEQQAKLQASVILYDVEVPDPWPTALEMIRRRHPESRVVLVARLADGNMWMEVLETGGYDLLLKPFPSRGNPDRGAQRADAGGALPEGCGGLIGPLQSRSGVSSVYTHQERLDDMLRL